MLFVVLVLICGLQRIVAPSTMRQDYCALSTPIVYEKTVEPIHADTNSTPTLHSTVFRLNYSQLRQWRTICQQFAADIGIDRDYFTDIIYNLLDGLQYPSEILNNGYSSSDSGEIQKKIEMEIFGPTNIHYESQEYNSTNSRMAIDQLSQSACLWASLISANRSSDDISYSASRYNGDLYYLHAAPVIDRAHHDFSNEFRSRTIPSSSGDALRRDFRALLDDRLHPCRDRAVVHRRLLASISSTYPEKPSWLSSYFSMDDSSAQTEDKDRIRPLIIIYQTIGAFTGGTAAMHTLHETLTRLGYPHVVLCNDSNRDMPACSDPRDIDVVVTGEWCHEVLAEYTQNRAHTGRGLQYYLGFHHADDSCAGRVAVSISHFLSVSLSNKVLGGLFLSTPMHNIVKDAFELLLKSEGDGVPGVVPVEKEDLILVDPDYFSDYPPSPPVAFSIPRGFKVLYARGIAAADMPLVLMRAKIVLDLALPGVERLAIEGILFGAIPIISNRWVGSSDVDYTGVLRVDAQNGSHISEMLQHVAGDYDGQLRSIHNAAFFHQTTRMWDRMRSSADVLFGSSHLHFVLYARCIDEEDKLVLQVLTLLYHYPLSSVDAYVADVLWFVRHHYRLYKTLQRAGYIRYDPLHPQEHLQWMQSGKHHSFIRFRPISEIAEPRPFKTVLLRDSPLVPAWDPLVIILRADVALCDWRFLLRQLNDLRSDELRVLVSDGVGGDDSNDQLSDALIVLAGPRSDYSRVMEVLGLLIGSSTSFTDVTRAPVDDDHFQGRIGSFYPRSSNVSLVHLSRRSVDQHLASICCLYEGPLPLQHPTSCSSECEGFRSRIRQNLGWVEAVQMLRSTGLHCPV